MHCFLPVWYRVTQQRLSFDTYDEIWYCGSFYVDKFGNLCFISLLGSQRRINYSVRNIRKSTPQKYFWVEGAGKSDRPKRKLITRVPPRFRRLHRGLIVISEIKLIDEKVWKIEEQLKGYTYFTFCSARAKLTNLWACIFSDAILSGLASHNVWGDFERGGLTLSLSLSLAAGTYVAWHVKDCFEFRSGSLDHFLESLGCWVGYSY